MIWEPEARDGPARAGKLKVGAYEVETPALLAVVDPDPKKQLVPLDEMRRAGVQVIMTSAFIAKKKVGPTNLKERLGWEGLLYTDSGTFQAYSRGVRVDPEESVRYQISAGSDIITPVDLFSLPTDSKEVAAKKAEVSFRRWLRARELKEEVSAPVQGGLYPDVRAAVARRYSEAGARLLAVGGIVPLMEEYKFKELVNAVLPVLASRPPEAAVHAFGAGHPLAFPLLAFLGVDLFDSAMYAIAAREGRYLTPFGTFRLEELVMMREFPCDCPACSSLSPRDLLSMSEEERTKFLALHNLYAAIKMVKEIRERIVYGTFHKWAIAFAHSHPRLYEAFAEALGKWRGYFERERNALPKSPVPEGCELCDSSPERDPVGEGTYGTRELFNVIAKRAYGKGLSSEEPLEALRPPRASFSPRALRELCSVTLNSPPKGRAIRKKDLKEVNCLLRPNHEVLVLWEGGEAKAVSLVSFAELSLASEEAVALLLPPEGLHGVKLGGLVGRVEAGDHGG
ncbi:tRNA-ribosyltransferase family protein [Ignicoccus hospitalis]|uniref:tRNA-guanine transglycosylase, various specificities n=1 Tax=Ignicoccus hospitalis (strain KIN4/I / DSM 18386 / JCM 14125) TaxID=453591 RepID=A8A9Q9_IGNH4|nr:tRNA-guanine transglycosylase [Ignicoccus hospitalis]ABU81661.1 tRNA-guanine transglycosylase, various specificities [Ignicoccus hospitalis KIN4/I]HIH89778.1 tRNA-guanine transglycosylase [Desulfurococcaceae archaeon]